MKYVNLMGSIPKDPLFIIIKGYLPFLHVVDMFQYFLDLIILFG